MLSTHPLQDRGIANFPLRSGDAADGRDFHRRSGWTKGRLSLVFPSAANLARSTIFVAVVLFGCSNTVSAQPFNPIRKLTTWYTDRSLVDIEIVGSTSMLPDLHRLQPERILKFRLERAYVHELTAERGPGFTIVHFGFDMETGLPDSLILAANQTGQFRETIPGVPKLSLREWGRRRLLVLLSSDSSASSLKRFSEGLENCKGAARDNGLFEHIWERRSQCRRPVYHNGMQLVGRQEDGSLVYIRCQQEGFRGLGCKLQFPFEGFSADLSFHREHLPRWREIVQRATAFLKSKQFK